MNAYRAGYERLLGSRFKAMSLLYTGVQAHVIDRV